MFAFLIFVSIFNSAIYADQARIAAVVNQHAITERELESRLDFAIATLNMPKTKESKDSMRDSVLQNLIVEKLQETSATEAGIKILNTDVDKAVENLAKENGMTVDQLNDKFKAMGIKIETLKDRLRAQVLWARFIRAMFGRQVIVTAGDIEKELEKIKRTFDADQYELIEIILPIDSKNPAKSKHDADNLFHQVNGAMTNFKMVAQQFGAQSGYAGWKSLGQMDEEISKVIQKIKVGEITKPIEVNNTYRIVKLIDKKLAGQGSYRNRKISLARVAITLPPEMNDEVIAIVENIAHNIKNAKNCTQFQQIGRDANGHVDLSPEQPMATFPEPLQVILDKVSVNQSVGPIQEGPEINFFMVCTVKNPEKDTMPSNEKIQEMLEQQKFSQQASRLLNKILAVARIAINSERALDKNDKIKIA